jgi:hypothetical protein
LRTWRQGRRGERLDEFDRFEEILTGAAQALEATGASADLSPVIRTREETERFSVLDLDMTVALRTLFDREGFLAARLDRDVSTHDLEWLVRGLTPGSLLWKVTGDPG